MCTVSHLHHQLQQQQLHLQVHVEKVKNTPVKNTPTQLKMLNFHTDL